MNDARGHSAAADNGERFDPVALTGRLTAALRARESARSDRLFEDPLAALLAGEEGEGLLEGFGDNEAIAVRTRFFDDALTRSATRSGLAAQLVLVAAGMDTRAFRLELPAGTTVYEVDRADVLTLKDRLLGRYGQDSGAGDDSGAGADSEAAPAPRCERRPVGADLAGDWPAALTAAGFEPGRPACWLVEGLVQYLTGEAVQELLDRITALSAPGSELLTDFVGRSFLDHPGTQQMLAVMEQRGAPWQFGTDRPEELLAPRGWRPEVTLMGAVGHQYGRWSYPDAPRDTPGVPQGFLVHARR